MKTKTDWTTDVKGSGQYAEVNGIRLYYETHGVGRPLILLHGGLGSGEMFGPDVEIDLRIVSVSVRFSSVRRTRALSACQTSIVTMITGTSSQGARSK